MSSFTIRLASAALLAGFLSSSAAAVEVFRKDELSLDLGFWTQGWYQNISDDNPESGAGDSSDFLLRRVYFSIRGTVNPQLGFFAHIAGDRLGQEGLPGNSGVGLGSGLALRDGWINLKLHDDDLILQMGRMYVPFTRNYGTTSTKGLLNLELDWAQGGYRGSIFYPSIVGRDDSLTLWGNVLEDKLQYRLMVGQGVSGASRNPGGDLRLAGRLVYSFFEPETSWFNSGTYRGSKRVLSLGIGRDGQSDLVLGGKRENYSAWTLDLLYEEPSTRGSLTLETSYISVDNSANAIANTALRPGDDGAILAIKAGYLIRRSEDSAALQPFAHFQSISPDEPGLWDTRIYGLGANYYLHGAANKLTLETTWVDQQRLQPGAAHLDGLLITLQVAAGI
ncbi:MAG: hypothetical protein GY769_25365 [bacterium]|nr:hypothetical protein [bacterium]